MAGVEIMISITVSPLLKIPLDNSSATKCMLSSSQIFLQSWYTFSGFSISTEVIVGRYSGCILFLTFTIGNLDPHTHIHTYMCVCVCVCVCIYIYIYITKTC
jgi:hypothetical protein